MHVRGQIVDKKLSFRGKRKRRYWKFGCCGHEGADDGGHVEPSSNQQTRLTLDHNWRYFLHGALSMYNQDLNSETLYHGDPFFRLGIVKHFFSSNNRLVSVTSGLASGGLVVIPIVIGTIYGILGSIRFTVMGSYYATWRCSHIRSTIRVISFENN
jgi:hypothetical protein